MLTLTHDPKTPLSTHRVHNWQQMKKGTLLDLPLDSPKTSPPRHFTFSLSSSIQGTQAQAQATLRAFLSKKILKEVVTRVGEILADPTATNKSMQQFEEKVKSLESMLQG